MNREEKYTELFSNPGALGLDEIPVLDYGDFMSFIDLLMREEGTHCLSYFVLPEEGFFRFICCMAADENHAVLLLSHRQPDRPGVSIPSLTATHFQFHIFEREIHDETGILFEGHPWLKPVRFPSSGGASTPGTDPYPYYSIAGEGLHEVGVGPVHAGIIEPGHFRFTCKGEQVLHLEIRLGYQHRGVEQLFVRHRALLPQAMLAEGIAGDTAVGHSLAWAMLTEALSGFQPGDALRIERTIALELERIAMHLADTAALCTDVGYQFGQVVCEALRTIVINTTQFWCGNRFGKGMIRAAACHHPMTARIAEEIVKNIREVASRYEQVADRIFSLPSVLSRFEGTGKITPIQASLAGAVGMAARSSGMHRDIRWSHPFMAYIEHICAPVVLPQGDVWARAMLRRQEIARSAEMIHSLAETRQEGSFVPMRNGIPALRKNAIGFSMAEGWRGEIVHVAVTGGDGELVRYKVKDPSLHNWTALALAVRNQEISDFPLCNKSFNLSYCGHDL